MNIIELAKEAGLLDDDEAWVSPHQEAMERFAALVRAESAKEDLEVLENLRKETIAQCEAGMLEAYQLGRAKRQWVDLTVLDLDAIIEKHYDDEMDLKAMILDGIAAFKEKNK